MSRPYRRGVRGFALPDSPGSGDGLEAPDKFLWDVHKYTNDYIRFADTKAAFTAAASTAMIGTLVGSSVLDSCFRTSPSAWSIWLWIAFLGMLLLAASVVLSVNAIRPRLWNSESVGYIFWESITGHGSAEVFSDTVGKLTASEQTIALSEHLFVLACIAKRKYHFVKTAIYAGIPGGMLAGISLFFRHALK